MGIRFDYKQEHRQNWLYIIAAMVATAFLVIFTLATGDVYYRYLLNDRIHLILVESYDYMQVYISLLISTTFSIQLRTLHKRFAMLNAFLT